MLWYSAVRPLGPGPAGLLTGVAPVSAALCGAVAGAACCPGPGVWLGISVVIGGLAVGLAVGLPPEAADRRSAADRREPR